MNIRIHDLCGIMLCLIFFFHRAVPIDYSSVWKVGILCVVYLLCRQLDKRFILIGIVVWSMIESLLAILQKLGFISSNHPMFDVTGSFGNPGPLGGLLAIGLLVNVTFLYHIGKFIFLTRSQGLNICLLTMERPRVSSSAYSRLSPKPSPLAREDTFTP